MSRRELLKAGIATGLYFAFPSGAECGALPGYNKIAASDNKALYLLHCHIIDVVQGVVQRDKTVVIRRGLIDVVTDGPPTPEQGAVSLDLKYQYLMPGLIDAHCHSTLTSESQLDVFGVFTTLRQFKRNFIQQFVHGVTTIRDMGAMPKMLQDGLTMIAKGDIVGPRVVYCNAFTNIYGGHPDIDPGDLSIFSGLVMAFTGSPCLWFKDTRELEEGMRQNSVGASFIKLTMDNQSLMCGLSDIPLYSDEHLSVIMKFAREHHLHTAGHIHTKFGFDRALRYGLNSMEHSVADASLSDKEVLEMAQKKIAVVPTMIIAQMLAAEEAYGTLPPQYRTDFIANEMAIRRQYLNSELSDVIEPSIHLANMASLTNYQKFGCENLYSKGLFLARPDIYFNILLRGPENLLKMKQAGVLIGCGTDSGVPFIYHGTLWREMEMLARVGFSNKEILQCATINNARILQMADKIGSIEKGKFADMIVLKENPLDKLEVCRSPQRVIKDGRVYDVTVRV